MKCLALLKSWITNTLQRLLSDDLEEWENEGCYFQEHFQRKELFELNSNRWIEDVKSCTETHEST